MFDGTNRQLRAAREATPSRRFAGRAMTRAELAELVAEHVWQRHGIESPIDRKYLGRLERGEVRWPNTRYRQALREILGAPSDRALGFHSANTKRMAKELDPVNRRSFFKAAAFGGVAVVGWDPVGPALASVRAVPGGEIEAITAAVEGLESKDATFGGGAMLHLAVELYQRVTTLRNEGVRSTRVDAALSRLQGDIGAWAGWLAYDAGDLIAARHYLAETVVHARMADLPDLEVRAMTYLVLLLNRTGHHRDALHCAEASRRIAAGWATPRVSALLHMRAAASHAALQDAPAFGASVAAAHREYDRGPDGDDPLWVRFVTSAELEGLAGDALTVLGEDERASAAFRVIADNPDPRYHRNSTYYSTKLADSLLRQGDVTGAVERAMAVLPDASLLQSERVVGNLYDLRARVERHHRVPVVGEFLEACDDVLSA